MLQTTTRVVVRVALGAALVTAVLAATLQVRDTWRSAEHSHSVAQSDRRHARDVGVNPIVLERIAAVIPPTADYAVEADPRLTGSDHGQAFLALLRARLLPRLQVGVAGARWLVVWGQLPVEGTRAERSGSSIRVSRRSSWCRMPGELLGLLLLDALFWLAGAGLLLLAGWSSPQGLRRWVGLAYLVGTAWTGVVGGILLVAGLAFDRLEIAVTASLPILVFAVVDLGFTAVADGISPSEGTFHNRGGSNEETYRLAFAARCDGARRRRDRRRGFARPDHLRADGVHGREHQRPERLGEDGRL